MAHSHTSIGTTARAEPVQGSNLLFANGYDRNENQPNRPLVRVLDIADTDDKYREEDYAYDDADDEDTERVTVTIKLSKHGIITETEERIRDKSDEQHSVKTLPQEDKNAETNNHTEETVRATLSNEPDDIANCVNDISEEAVATGTTREHFPQHDIVLVGNREQFPSSKDNLYNEYESFVERSSPKDSKLRTFSSEDVIDLTQDTPVSSEENTTNSPAVVKPKVKVVKPVVLKSFQSDSPSSTRPTSDTGSPAASSPAADRSKLFSPKTRTPIVIELSGDDDDEGQDFVAYLQELKQVPSQTIASPDQDHEKRKHRKLDRRNSDISAIIHTPIHRHDRRASSDIIIISDDEGQSKDNSNGLMDFNFASLQEKKTCKGGNNVSEEIAHVDSTPSSEEDIDCLYHDASDEFINDISNCDVDESSEEENEDDEDDNDVDDTKKHNTDDDEDKDDGNEKGSGSHESGDDADDYFDDADEDFDNHSSHSNDNNEPNGQHGNEGYFSPGMRSRSSIGVETLSDFENAETEDSSSDETTCEDAEVSEILEVFHRQERIDCHFETIESRGLTADTDSESSSSSGSVTDNINTVTENTKTGSVYFKGFRKVTPKPTHCEALSSVSVQDDDMNKTMNTGTANETSEIVSDDEDFSSISLLQEDTDMASLVSDDSSVLEIENESDFESAIEEEFWAVFTDDDIASVFSDSESESNAITSKEHQVPHILNDSVDADHTESDGEYESANNEDIYTDEEMELKYCYETPEKQLVTNISPSMSNGDEFCTHESDSEPDASIRKPCEERIRNLRSSIRNVSYMAPYYKPDIDSPAINHCLQKKLKLICKYRQACLAKVLPTEQESCKCSDITDETAKYIENDIDWKALKSKYNSNIKLRAGENDQEVIQDIGRCFYIYRIGDRLYLPCGPRLKKPGDDGDPNGRSIYFRGVPGILHNAQYKMSGGGHVFPRLAPPTKDSASRKILHACNRLAVQQLLSPEDPRPDNKHGMMLEDRTASEESDGDNSDSTISLGLTQLLMAARDLLNASRFEDAEAAFLKLYKEIQERPEDCACMLVETLTGLADICIRRSRMCRSNPLEWQWLCMHGIALLHYTVEFCESELENQLDNQVHMRHSNPLEWQWLCMHGIALLHYTVEFCESELETQLDNQEIEFFTEQKATAETRCRPLEDAFLRALYNCLKHDDNAFDPFQSFSLPTTPERSSQSRSMRMFPLSSDMPQYLVVPGMRYRVTDQGLTKQNSDEGEVAVDWLAKFQHYCKDRLQSKDSTGVTEKILKSTSSRAEDDTESILSNNSHDSLDWDHSDLQGIEELTVDPHEDSPGSEYSFEYELVTGDTANEGWDFFLHQRRNCNFESVVQVASKYEKSDERESRKLAKETHETHQHEKSSEKSEKAKKKHHEPRDMVSPLHEHSISLTLARSYCRLADKLVSEEEYRKAEAVYEKILDIVDTIQDGTAGMLRFSARIMKNLGTVKSKQGKSSSGLVLLNKALNTYRDLQDEEANFEIAVSLIELGNGYIVGKNHEDSVFDDVIIAICDFFEKDAADSHSVSNSSSGSSQLSQMTSSLGSNTEERNVDEAVMCYSEAIALLEHYEADEKQIDMFAKAVMRLGDCYFMQKDYDKALECYEKALGMFKTNNVFGKDSLMENAHVLCMLGVSSFMLHVYPRAASVFETALHMVRCAYGFKRTFLNGMLQSLSGITYYKMKNYHKCVSMCYQGYETYCEIFGESMSRLDKQKFWLICQTLYVMGNSYNILNLQHKAMKYLTIARSLMKSSKCRERRQFMRVLQILGDAYFAQYDYKTALTFYNEALDYGDCESQVSFDEVFDPNCASDEMTIHNHLVSKSAEAHLSMQQYQNAVHYLEQAHDMQEVMGEDIKEDLINTLNQLGHMHSVAGDVNKALESYKECLEVFSEIHKGKLGPEMCTTLGNLAAICYVKACLSDSPEDEHEMTKAADTYFQDAINLDRNAEVCVKYGNFLYSQCNFSSAIFYLTDALSSDHVMSDIVYGGLEKVTLPELLQDEVDTQEEICLPSSSLARYLLILCHKTVLDFPTAEAHLICLMEEVTEYDIPILHSLLGYAMMEMGLFEEAAECFMVAAAAESEEDYFLACENYCVCLLVMVERVLRRGVENIVAFYGRLARKNC